MHKVTYEKHKKMLTFILDEHYKLLKKVPPKYAIISTINNIILGIEHNLKNLDKFTRKQLYILNQQERLLLDSLNEYRELNNELSKKRILEYIKLNKDKKI